MQSEIDKEVELQKMAISDKYLKIEGHLKKSLKKLERKMLTSSHERLKFEKMFYVDEISHLDERLPLWENQGNNVYKRKFDRPLI